MLNWQTGDLDPTSTKIAQTASLLQRAGSGLTIQQFVQMPYKMAKKHAKDIAIRANLETYRKSMIHGPLTTKRLLSIKAHWGLERALAICPLYQTRTYILARANALPQRSICNCSVCDNSPPTIDITIWLCDKTREDRKQMLTELSKQSSTAHS